MREDMNLIEILDANIYQFNELVNFNTDELKTYEDLLQLLEDVNSSKESNQLKGDTLEKIVNYLIQKTNIFEVYQNVRTSSNEIDLFVRLNSKGNMILAKGLIKKNYENFICECKNHNKKIDVTWIGKFINLTKLGDFNFGIMFSFHGLTGKDTWNYASGLTKKFYLKEGLLIIDINYEDLKTISLNKNILDIIDEKITNIEHDINLSSYLKTHPNSNFMNE